MGKQKERTENFGLFFFFEGKNNSNEKEKVRDLRLSFNYKSD